MAGPATPIDGEPWTSDEVDEATQQIIDHNAELAQRVGNRTLTQLEDDLSGAFAPLAAGIEGTGMPEGVVTAPVGTVYRDLAATNGAVVWVKASGSGNTGWRVAWGDTGWRDVTALISPSSGGPIAGGSLRVRRLGSQVVWHFDNLSLTTDSDNSAVQLLAVPTGFRSTRIWGLIGRTQGVATYYVVWSSGTTLYVLGRLPASTPTWPASHTLSGQFDYAADSDWPTTLPGTAA